MKCPWFWGTLGFWILLGAGVSWALIESPFETGFKNLGRFEGEVNGLPQKHQLEVCRGLLADGWEETAHRWEKEGWRPLAGSLDPLSILIGLPPDPSPLSAWMRAGLYQKKEQIRLFVLWNDKTSTYRWTVEFQENSKKTRESIERKKIPLEPPGEAFNLFQGTAENFQMTTWCLPSHSNPFSRFKLYCSSQGFTWELLHQEKQESTLFLRKGNLRLIAIINQQESMDRVTLGFLPSLDPI